MSLEDIGDERRDTVHSSGGVSGSGTVQGNNGSSGIVGIPVGEMGGVEDPASDKQIGLLRRMLKDDFVPNSYTEKALAQINAGIGKREASSLIGKIKTLIGSEKAKAMETDKEDSNKNDLPF